MSTTTVIFFVISASTFAILLALAVALFLKNRNATQKLHAPEVVPSVPKTSYCVDVELTVLESSIQITNALERPMRLEATSADPGLELISSDQWIQRFSEGVNTYRIFASSADEKFEQVVVELKVTQSEVSVKPVMKTENLHILIWKMKPVLLANAKHIVERQVFSGLLQKTVNFDRGHEKYYRIRVTTNSIHGKAKALGLESQSNIEVSESQPLLTLRVEPNKVVASNVSGRQMQVTVSQASAHATLKRMLQEEEIHEMPVNGIFSFSIMPGKSQEPKDLLRLQIDGQSVLVEPYTKFGSVPLICDVRSPGKASVENLSQIVAGEIMSQLQLPRKSYTYILIFYMRRSQNVADAETSYTLQ